MPSSATLASPAPRRSAPIRFARWILGGLLAGALVATAPAQDLALTTHTQSDGLSNLSVTAMVQLPDGRLVVGTENGLYRHDGARITRIDAPGLPLANRHISTLAPDGRGGVWVGMISGLARLGPQGLEVIATGSPALSVRQGHRTIAATADGGALVAAMDGLYTVRRAGSGWRATPAFAPALRDREPSLADIHAVLVEPDGSWWLGCGLALCRWRDGALIRFGERDGPKPARWGDLLRTRDGALWARGQTQVARQAPGSDRFEDLTPPRLGDSTVRLQLPLAEDTQGRVLTSSDDGVLRWQSGRWTRFGAEHGLDVGSGVHAILQDRDHDLWLGTAGHGLVHWRGYEHWRQWTRRQGVPSDDLWTFLEEAPGRMWLGTGNGAALLDPESGRVDVRTPGGTSDQVGSLARDEAGQLWMATYSGQLFRQRAGGAWQRVAKGLPLVFVLQPALGGGMWAGTDKGLFFVPPAGGAAGGATGTPPRVVPAPGMAADRSKSLTVFAACTSPQRRTWFATSAGLIAHDEAHGMSTPAIAGLPDGLSIEKVACGRDGALWVASPDHRLWRVASTVDGRGAGNGSDAGVGDAWRADALQPGEVLGRRTVMALLSDRRGWLWVTTDDGVLVWNGGPWRRFDDSNGLGWNDCNQNALVEDAAGDIWIGTSRGATQVIAPERLLDPARVALHLTRVTRDQVPMPLDRAWTADWSAGALEIAWAAPVFRNRATQQVRYRLRGLDEQWRTTAHEDVVFPALPGGRYVFEARVENIDLGLVSELAALPFEIRPPWWRSAWALAAAGALAVALIALAHRWRVRAWVRRQRELEGLVGRRTAELKASYEQMRTLALTDGLTGAMNRRAITDLAAREIARARRGDAAVTLMLIDIDHFKRINDTHGHPAGDAVLTQLVLRLKATMRDYDAIGRWGGEEFLLVLPGLSMAQEQGRRRAQALQRCIGDQPFDIGTGTPLAATCSAGVVGVPPACDESLEALVARADAALYDAKHGGRDRAVIVS